MRLVPALPAVALWLLGAPARAEDVEPAPPFEVAASTGYALPIGSAESGGRLRDTTFGLVPFELDAAWRVTSRVGIALWGRYAVGIPTLCQTASDCTSSLGTDVSLALRARVFLPALGPLTPEADVGVGYEWLTTKLSDSGVTSSRAYHGPLLLSAELAAPFRLGAHWTLGPALGLALGEFTTYSLETPVRSDSGTLHGRALHAWLSLGARLAVRF